MIMRATRFFIFLTLIVLILSSVPVVTYAAATGDWSTSAINGTVGAASSFDAQNTAIALDSDRNVHVIYVDYSDGTYPLFYATKASGSATWNISRVGGTEEGRYVSIAIDLGNNIYICYTDYNGYLKYAMKPAGSSTWSIYPVGTVPDQGMYASIAVDVNKNVHISYIDSAGYFKYANKAFGSSTWTVQQIGTVQEAQYTSIAVDSKGTMYIAYYSPMSGELKLAYKSFSDTSFSIENIDIGETGNVGLYPSIAIDAEDHFHIAYYDDEQGDVKYATNAGGDLSCETVDLSGAVVVGHYTSIVVDTLGIVYISYQDVTNGFLNYAVGKAGSWYNYTIDNSGNTGFASSIALDSSNMVFISYFHEDTSNEDLDLMYASNGYDLSVAKTGAGNGFVTSSIPGINCDLLNTDCSDVYGPGSVVTLNAVPQMGSYFGGWSWTCSTGTCTSNALSVKIAMDQATTVTATFTSTPPSILTWSKTFGQGLTGASQNIDLIRQTRDGGFIAVGSAFNTSTSTDDFLLLKLDPVGGTQWVKTYKKFFEDMYPISRDDRAHSIQQTADGGYIVAVDASHIYSDVDAWLLKFDKDGIKEWQYTFGLSVNPDHVYSVQQTADGGYIVAGSSSFLGDEDFWILKLDSSGSPVWSKTYGGMGFDEARDVKQTSDGGYIAIGTSYSFTEGDSDIWIMKLDNKGNYEWQKLFGYGNAAFDEGYSVQQTSNGEYIAAGMESDQFWALRLDSYGIVQWEKTFGDTLLGFAHSIQETLSGDLIIAGLQEISILAMYLTPDGNLGTGTWQKTYQLSSTENASSGQQSIQQTSDGGFILSGGYIDGEDHHILLMKLDLNGDIPGCDGVTITSAGDAGNPISVDGIQTFSEWNSDPAFFRDTLLLFYGEATNTIPDTFICETAGPPQISLSPVSPYNFGNVVTGTSAARTFTIRNTGDSALILGQIAHTNPLASPPFSINNDNCSGHTIQPLGTCTFVSRFLPAATGTFSDTFDIPSNVPTGPLAVELRGTGVVQTYYLSVFKSGTGTGTVVSSEAPVPVMNCGINCEDAIASYPRDSQVKLKAAADAGSVFESWSGACSGNGDCDLVMNANKTVSAKFAINILTISTQAGQGGSISPTGKTVNFGETALFTVMPDDGYHTVNVSGCGVTKYEGGVIAAKKKKKNVKTSAAGEVYITGPITADCTVSASFAINTFTVTPSAGEHGNINPSIQQTVNYNDTVPFSVKADDGYHIQSVSGCNGTAYTAAKKKKKKKLSAVSEMTYTTGHITESCTVTASFAINTFTVTPKAGEHGSIDPSAPLTVNYLDTVSFTVKPDEGCHIESVTGCGIHPSEGGTYITDPITGDCTVEAAFVKETFTTTILKSGTGNGTITGSGVTCEGNACEGTYEAGSKLTLKIKPDDGYRVIDVKINGKSIGPVQTLTLKEIMSNFAIEIVFGPISP
jgi:hypothetical protein